MPMSSEMLALIKGAKNKFSRGGGKIYKLKEGKTQFRILPVQSQSPIAVSGQFWMEYGVHWIKTEANGKPVAVVGNSQIVYGIPSPVDAAIELAIKGAISDEDIKLMKEWKARSAILLNAVIRSGSDASEDPVALELTPTVFGTVLSMIEEYSEESGNILDYKVGFDFVIEKTGKGFDTKYTVMPKPVAKPVSKETVEKAIDLFALVEKEFFRGEDNKAITAIVNMTGIKAPALGAPPAARALLTRPSASVPDAETTEIAAIADEIVASTPEPAPAPKLSKAEVARAALAAAEAEEAEDAAKATKAAVKTTAPKAAPKAAKPAAAPVAAKEFGADLDPSEIDSVLTELDALV